ncbi:MAG: hypothetical protein MOB07_16420 [Acidobacteria bacterium]|nr:hypothetical protein [Acidobacteriota bacterium]
MTDDREREDPDARDPMIEKTDKPKPRIAIVKVGQHEARFDGKRFTSEDESTANLLNSSLEVYEKRGRRAFTDDFSYWPDNLLGMARVIAEYHGGELVSCDPIDYSQYPEGTVF